MKPKLLFFIMMGVLVLAIGSSAAGYMYTSTILKTTRDEFASKELELEYSYDHLRYLEQLELSTEELENDLGGLTSIYPEKKMQAQIILQLRRLADDTGVNIEGEGISFPPTDGLPSANSQLSESEAVGGLVGMPVQLTIGGSFDDTMTFLEDLENFRRLINIASLEMSGGSGKVTTNINIEVLVQQSIKKKATKTTTSSNGAAQ